MYYFEVEHCWKSHSCVLIYKVDTVQFTEYKFVDKLKCDEMEIIEDKELNEVADSRLEKKVIKVSIDEL